MSIELMFLKAHLLFLYFSEMNIALKETTMRWGGGEMTMENVQFLVNQDAWQIMTRSYWAVRFSTVQNYVIFHCQKLWMVSK